MKKFIIIIVLLLFIAGVSGVIMMYNRIWRNNVKVAGGDSVEFFIPTGSMYDDVYQSLQKEELLVDPVSFNWVAGKKNYPRHVKPGRYIILSGMNNNRLVSLLRSGLQEPVNLVFNSIRTKEKLAGVVASQIEADSLSILSLFENMELLEKHQLSRDVLLGVFIPNTYEIYWNTSAERLLERMMREYQIFWNENRLARARKIGLEPMEVVTLAAIVDEESLFPAEEERIAGVYINRLNKRIRLHADPTVKFAAGDMNMTRVLTKHLEIDSPYNTYRNGGLPPGPIVIPSISAIDAVLNYERHNYLYFCAKEDFSGYHNFATSLDQHNKNARSYQNALNRRKIFN
jgi:UPF0755 protein